MISSKEVQHIAKLARIQLSDQELEKFQRDLAQIVEYFQRLRQVDVSNIAPMTHSIPLRNVARTDDAHPEDSSILEQMIALAPALKHGFVKIQAILS